MQQPPGYRINLRLPDRRTACTLIPFVPLAANSQTILENPLYLAIHSFFPSFLFPSTLRYNSSGRCTGTEIETEIFQFASSSLLASEEIVFIIRRTYRGNFFEAGSLSSTIKTAPPVIINSGVGFVTRVQRSCRERKEHYRRGSNDRSNEHPGHTALRGCISCVIRGSELVICPAPHSSFCDRLNRSTCLGIFIVALLSYLNGAEQAP